MFAHAALDAGGEGGVIAIENIEINGGGHASYCAVIAVLPQRPTQRAEQPRGRVEIANPDRIGGE